MNNDTICAISTAPGQGAIAVVRVSGQHAIAACNAIFKAKNNTRDVLSQREQTVSFGNIINLKGETVDEVLLTVFRNPHSYTGEDSVEISCHGSAFIQQQILQLLIANGCRMAEPGEYTLRAFMNGKMDLSQAEAVADLIAAESAAAHKLAINQLKGGFSEELNRLRTELLDFTSLIELELDFSEEEVEFANRDQLNTLIKPHRTGYYQTDQLIQRRKCR